MNLNHFENLHQRLKKLESVISYNTDEQAWQ